jgi:NCAIR mutase (PurE)-related protein
MVDSTFIAMNRVSVITAGTAELPDAGELLLG